MTSMIRYNPPKSQVWGHQVGRLGATSIVERGLKFIDAECTVLSSQPSELEIVCNSSQPMALSECITEIDRILGRPITSNELPMRGGHIFHQRVWPFSAEMLPAVADCFDQLADLLKSQDVTAHASTFWVFAWRDEIPPLRPLESAGGMFGIHLGSPHRITTMFSFRGLDRYTRIKSALADLGLANLSDKHLRPRTSIAGPKTPTE